MSKKDGRKAGPFHPGSFSFFSRFRACPQEEFDHASLAAPWIQERINLVEDASQLELLLNHWSEAPHELMAAGYGRQVSSS
jgi:hypothetical protein